MSDDASLDEIAQEVEGDEDERSRDLSEVKLQEVAYKRSENVNPREVDLDRHVGLEHIEPNSPSPNWESLDDLSSTKRRFESGDILFAKLRPNLEKAAQPDFDGVASTDIFPIVAEQDINSKYLLYRLSSKSAFDHARRTSAGTRMPRTSWNLFSNFDFRLPPLLEQRKIATILHTIDQAIQKTEDIIEQTKKLKKGVMKELFTEGYYHHDDTEDGTLRWRSVPASWTLPQLSEVADINPSYNGVDSLVDYIEMDAVDTILPDPQYVSKRNPSENSGRMFKTNDTLFARITPCTENGKICFVNELESEVGIGSTEHVVLSPNDEILPKYLYHYTRTHPVRDYAISRMRGSTGRQRVPFDVFRKELHIPLPSNKEQANIVRCLDSFDDRIKNNQRYQVQLRHLKRGLMQDILSGDVRTADVEIDIPEEVAKYG